MKKALFLALLFSITQTFSQGNTKASINGIIEDQNNQALVNANIKMVHTPTGSTYGSVTSFDGHYHIANMKVGGPYTINISYVGYENFERKGIFLLLGQTFNLSIQLKSNANELNVVEITVNKNNLFDGNKTGAETKITKKQIHNLPTTSRSIADFVRLTPQAQLEEGDDGFAISLAGNNSKFNAIYLDGAVSNDVFGLSGSGTNGGRTGVSPFSLDAIEQFQVQIAPFDVRVGGFVGGAINAITRSGTNKISGSAYYYTRNENLVGKTPKNLIPNGENAQKLNEFEAKTFGLRIGGPIIKDKAFFFVNYERQDDVTPQPFNIGNYNGNSDALTIANISEFMQSNYNYDIGAFNQNDFTIKSDKFTAKFDFNFSDKHKLSIKHNLTKATNLKARHSNTNFLGFLNGSGLFTSTTNTTALEINSNFNSKYANNLIVGFTSVRDDRDPTGKPFPTIVIHDGAGDIQFGSEPFSAATFFDSNIFTFTNNFEIHKGKHSITLGTHNEWSSVKNLFFAFNYGQYEYDNVTDFFNGNIDRYLRGYSLLSNTVGDDSTGVVDFKVFQAGLYAQDEVQLTNDFKLTVGIRFDMPIWEDGLANQHFNNQTVNLLENYGKNLQGARVGKSVSSTVHVAPRIGFNWNVNGKKRTQIRGGAGIFTSRIPLVWLGGSYISNGISSGFLFQDADFGSVIAPFNPNVNTQPVGTIPGSGATEGNIDLFASNFKLPQVVKLNLAFDQKLPWAGFTFSGDVLYQKTIYSIAYENLNLKNPIGNLTGTGDNRPIYNRFDRIDGTYNDIILVSNTSKGEAYNFVATLSKSFQNGFLGSFSYSYGDSKVLFDGTSIANNDQWSELQNVNGSNGNHAVTRSDFSTGSRIIGNVSYEKKWNKNLKSTFGLVYAGRQGNPYSYTYQNGNNNVGDLQNDDSNSVTALIYVPKNQNDIHLTTNNWAELDAFISGDRYLNSRRGKYTERNAVRSAWSNVIDLKFLQSVTFKNNTLQLSLDIFNFTNLLNKNWGQVNYRPKNSQFLSFEGFQADGTTPRFSFNAEDAKNLDRIDDLGLQSSRWQMQIGVRYLFD